MSGSWEFKRDGDKQNKRVWGKGERKKTQREIQKKGKKGGRGV